MSRIAFFVLLASCLVEPLSSQGRTNWEDNRAAVLERIDRARRGEPNPVDENHPRRSEVPEPRRGGELQVALPVEPVHLNYAIEASHVIAIVWDELHARLAVPSRDRRSYVPELAKRWEVEDVLVVRTAEASEGDPASNALTTVLDDSGLERWIGAIETRGEGGERAYRVVREEEPSRWFEEGEVLRVDRGASMTFHLREGVRWHDGEPFDAHDVQFSAHCQKNAVTGEKLALYGRIIDARALDDRTVRFVFEEQYFDAFSVVASLPLLPAHLYEVERARSVSQAEALEDLARNRSFVGLGPYRFREWKPGDRIVLERSPHWFGEDAWVDRIAYRFLQPANAVRELRAGTLDFVFSLSSSIFEELRVEARSASLVTGFALGTDYNWIGWNCRRGPLRSEKVRRALSSAFDVQGFLERWSTGLSYEVTGHQPRIGPAYPEQIEPLAFDVRRTSELLAQEGFLDRDGDGWIEGPDGEPFEILFLYTSNSAGSIIATHLAEGLRAAKVRVVQDAVEWSTYLTRRGEGKYDAIFQRWVPDLESDMFQVWHSQGAPLETRSSNYVGYANPFVDRLIERARRTLDEEKRWALWREAQRVIYDEQPYRFLYSGASGAAWRDRWRGVRMYDGKTTFRLREWFLVGE